MSNVGARLKEYRTRAGLSQRELARRAGLTNAAISLIEQDRVSPTVETLMNIVSVLSMTMSDFFASQPGSDSRPFFESGAMPDIGTGGIQLFDVANGRPQRKLQILHEFHEPGSDSGSYQHEGEEGGVVVSGTLEVTVADERRVLRRGDAYYFDSRVKHRMRNIGDEPCEVVSALTPPSF